MKYYFYIVNILIHNLIAAINIHCTSITAYVPHNISDTSNDWTLLGQDVGNGIDSHIRANIINFTYSPFAHRELTMVDVLYDTITLGQPWIQNSITAFVWWEFISLRWISNLARKTWWTHEVTAPSPRWSHNENLLGQMIQTSKWLPRWAHDDLSVTMWVNREHLSLSTWHASSDPCVNIMTGVLCVLKTHLVRDQQSGPR